MATKAEDTLTNLLKSIRNITSDGLENNEFLSRSIGMANSYEGLMTYIQLLGREPVSLLGKDYPFIFDHVRRNVMQGTYDNAYGSKDCPKFTFYKEVPTIKFADPYLDPMNYLGGWTPDMKFETTINSDAMTQWFYSESYDESPRNIKINQFSANAGTAFGNVESYGNELDTCDLIRKTNDIFKNGKSKTLIARFHGGVVSYDDQKQTAISRYGMSHGRNLLKLKPDAPNGYDNPYCRVWTYHHQYHTLKDTIRPFDLAPSQHLLETNESAGYLSGSGVSFRVKDENGNGGSDRLDKYGVLNYSNGLVNIAPTAKLEDYFDGTNDTDYTKISAKRCMFSLENLAWKDDKRVMGLYDAEGLSPEQKGPLGGRIMWFPPYNLKFSEQVSVNWNGHEFIGRGEKIYTYTNTERRGNLSFTVLIDHPSLVDYWTGHDGESGIDGKGHGLDPYDTGGVSNTNNHEQTLLRFFAGCDILTAKKQTYKEPIVNEDEEDEEQETVVTPDEDTPVNDGKKKKIVCFLYYPNNYCGESDRASKTVNPVDYLMNGIGTQKYIDNGKTKDFTVEIGEFASVLVTGMAPPKMKRS